MIYMMNLNKTVLIYNCYIMISKCFSFLLTNIFQLDINHYHFLSLTNTLILYLITVLSLTCLYASYFNFLLI